MDFRLLAVENPNPSWGFIFGSRCILHRCSAHLQNVERGTWASVFSKPGEMGGLGCCKSSKRSISRELFILAGDLKEARILDLMMLSNAIYSNMVIFNTETATAMHTACVAYFRETFLWSFKKYESHMV